MSIVISGVIDPASAKNFDGTTHDDAASSYDGDCIIIANRAAALTLLSWENTWLSITFLAYKDVIKVVLK